MMPLALIILIPLTVLITIIIGTLIFGGPETSTGKRRPSIISRAGQVSALFVPGQLGGGHSSVDMQRTQSDEFALPSPSPSPLPVRLQPTPETTTLESGASPRDLSPANESPASKMKRQQTMARSKEKISKAMERMYSFLPLVLLLVFVFLPTVSRTIFSVWDCKPYTSGPGTEVNYLRRDESVICGTPEHDRMVILAIALVLLWPIGMQLLFFLTLWTNRAALREGKDNAASRATRFLTGGYKNPYFYWETIELFRRLTCSGFVILIPAEFIFMRIILALLVSLPILVFTAVLQPFRNREDNALALVSQSVLVLAYGSCALVRIVNSDLADEDKRTIVGFTSPSGPFLLLAFCCMGYLVLLVSAYGFKINEEFQKQIRKRGITESQESSTWILVCAAGFGITGLVVGGIIFGPAGGAVGASIFFPAGGALGTVLYSVCKGDRSSLKAASQVSEDKSNATGLENVTFSVA